MLLKQITKLSRLHKNELRAIKILQDYCMQHDKFRIKLYWNILQNRLTQEFNDFFYYIDGNLAGYLALFTFEMDEAEVSIMVHPKYRQRGLGKKLMKEAFLELQQRHIKQCLFICPQGSKINATYLKSLRPTLILSQVEMSTKEIPVYAGLPDISLRLANSSDLPLTAKIGALGFKASFDETLQRFTENMQEKNRRIWLLSTPSYSNIGKIHIRYEDNQVFIHDVCILPEYQRKKYALAMMVEMLRMLRQAGQHMFTLDVESDNIGALKLYALCGFKKISAYDFLRMPLVNVMKIYE